MSAPSCIAFIGLRFPVFDEEIESLEERRDHRQIEARNAGLQSYWGNFNCEAPRHVLFVGTRLASLGPEGQSVFSLDADELAAVIERTRALLSSTTMTGGIGLHIKYHPD